MDGGGCEWKNLSCLLRLSRACMGTCIESVFMHEIGETMKCSQFIMCLSAITHNRHSFMVESPHGASWSPGIRC